MTQPASPQPLNCKVSILQISPDRQTWQPKVKEVPARILLDRPLPRLVRSIIG